MWILQGVLAGLVAGAIMGCVSQLGYWLGWLKSHLVVVDGEFALRKMKQKISTPAVYITGILIHLVTSIAFGIVYMVLAQVLGFAPGNKWIMTIYILLLWLAMLLVALPVAGQGLLGKRIHRYVWLEQLILHAVFGISFWWALGIF